MSKGYLNRLYKTQAWKRCRRTYLSKVHGLCECCLAKGIYRPADIVHHKIFLTEENARDPEVVFAFKNLIAVCRQCHEEIHNNAIFLPKSKSKYRRYDILPDGTVIMHDDQLKQEDPGGK